MIRTSTARPPGGIFEDTACTTGYIHAVHVQIEMTKKMTKMIQEKRDSPGPLATSKRELRASGAHQARKPYACSLGKVAQGFWSRPRPSPDRVEPLARVSPGDDHEGVHVVVRNLLR